MSLYYHKLFSITNNEISFKNVLSSYHYLNFLHLYLQLLIVPQLRQKKDLFLVAIYCFFNLLKSSIYKPLAVFVGLNAARLPIFNDKEGLAVFAVVRIVWPVINSRALFK